MGFDDYDDDDDDAYSIVEKRVSEQAEVPAVIQVLLDILCKTQRGIRSPEPKAVCQDYVYIVHFLGS